MSKETEPNTAKNNSGHPTWIRTTTPFITVQGTEHYNRHQTPKSKTPTKERKNGPKPQPPKASSPWPRHVNTGHLLSQISHEFTQIGILSLKSTILPQISHKYSHRPWFVCLFSKGTLPFLVPPKVTPTVTQPITSPSNHKTRSYWLVPNTAHTKGATITSVSIGFTSSATPRPWE